ncbi:hypothetical protein W909_00705 [Dickeya zeae EC1]|nr:hypothetical protein W909_00705 [Dickeya zeae EC1]
MPVRLCHALFVSVAVTSHHENRAAGHTIITTMDCQHYDKMLALLG